MLLLTCLLTYLLGNRNSRDGWNVLDLVTVQQCSIISGYIVLFLTLGLTTYYLLGNRKRAIFNPESVPYKRTYTFLLGNRTMVLPWSGRGSRVFFPNLGLTILRPGRARSQHSQNGTASSTPVWTCF